MGQIGQTLAAELEKEGAATRRILERLPADRLDWRPHPKSMTLGELALHLAGLPGVFAKLGRQDGLDAATVDFKQTSPESKDQILAAWGASLAEAKAFFGDLDEETANGSWRLSLGERELAKMPRHELVRSLMFNHSYHHRGQLSVYLRLLDVPVPAIYGNSADEDPFAAGA